MVTFDVRLKIDVRNIAKNGRIVFEPVDLDEEKGYDPSTGIFTSPAEGMHVFDWTTLTQQGKYAITSIVVNGIIKSWNYCSDLASKTCNACNEMTAVKLKQGNKAWIGVSKGPADMRAQYTSLSGYRL